MTTTPYTWEYPARLVRVIDGDTLDLVLDQGMHTWRTERVRLHGVNAPERNSADPAAREIARAATEYLDRACRGDEEWPLLARTLKNPDAFGRYLAVVRRTGSDVSVNAELLAAGLAVEFAR